MAWHPSRTLPWVNRKGTEYSWKIVFKVNYEHFHWNSWKTYVYAEWGLLGGILTSCGLQQVHWPQAHSVVILPGPAYAVSVSDACDLRRWPRKLVLPCLSSGMDSGMWPLRLILWLLVLVVIVWLVFSSVVWIGVMCVPWGVFTKERLYCPAGWRVLIVWSRKTARWKN